MIRRIILENYMAHGRTVIEPAAGLTVLVGPNNCGKSAVVHALQTLCYNTPADFAVRHGEKEASVTVETDDGHILTWRRKKGAVTYVIDGREVGRLRGDVPEDLHRYLRMPRIDPSNETGDPFFVHFGLQKAPIFLLDDPPARAATFFASSSDAEKLLEMQKRHREKVKDARRDDTRLSLEAATLDQRLEATASVTDLSARMTDVENAHRGLLEMDRAVALRRESLRKLEKGRRLREVHAGCVTAASTLTLPPRWADSGPLTNTIARVKSTSEQLRRDRARAAAIEALQVPPAWHDTTPLMQSMKAIRAMGTRCKRIKSVGNLLTSLSTPPEHRRGRIDAISNFLARGRECVTRLGGAKASLIAAEASLNGLREQVQAWAEQHPNCPTCGAPTHAESLLTGEHAHV